MNTNKPDTWIQEAVQGPAQLMKAPPHFDAAERKIWNGILRASPHLNDVARRPLLEALVSAMHRLRQARLVLKREGLTISGKSHPCVVQSQNCEGIIASLSVKLAISVGSARDTVARGPAKRANQSSRQDVGGVRLVG